MKYNLKLKRTKSKKPKTNSYKTELYEKIYLAR